MRRFRGSNIDHDQPIDFFRRHELPEVDFQTLHYLPSRFLARKIEIGQGRNRRSRVPNGAWPDAGFDLFQVLAALVDHLAAGGPHFSRDAVCLAAEPKTADFVAADDEVVPTGKIERGEFRQGGDQARRGDKALL